MLIAALTWSPLASGDEVKGPQIRYSAIHANSGGVYIYVPEKWGILHLEVTNPLDQSHELLSTTYFDDKPTLQFGRRAWVPPRSRLHTWHPALLPRLSPEANERFQFHSLVLDTSSTDEVLTRDDAGEKLHSGVLPAQFETSITGLIDRLDGETDVEGDSAYDLVAALCASRRMRSTLTHLRDRIFAPDDVSLQTLHQLVIADSRALDDPAGLAAIRRCVHKGGRLWVMLDRVDPPILERILGDEFRCAVVDRVGLTAVRIESNNKDGGTQPIEAEYEQPVELVRVVVTGADVTCTVNGWPAALWKSFGAGQLLVTTLAPRGWMPATQAKDTASVNAGGHSPDAPVQKPTAAEAGSFAPRPPMDEMATSFFLREPARLTVSQALAQQAGEYIGYAIPSRWLIVSLLGGFVSTVVVLGTWLLRRSALEHLGWLSPGLAICVTAVLLIIGRFNRHAIPVTAATVELVEAIPGADDVHSQGAVMLYNPEGGPGAIGATHGGLLIPDMTGLEGSTKRMVWKDVDTWNWEHLALSGGERPGTFLQAQVCPERFEARAKFGPDGLSGRVSGSGITAPGDALIATRMGRMGVELNADGRFRAPSANVFGDDQYLAAGMLSDEQDRRRRTYAQVLPELFSEDSSGHPLLLLWADRRNSGFQFGEGRRLLGASLMAIPLVFERPPGNTHVRIPAPFLPFRNTAHPDGRLSPLLWDHRRQAWMERSKPASAWFRFQLPAELLPVELTRARLVISVAGPVGRLEISALRRTQDGGRKQDRPVGEHAAGEGRDEIVSVKTWNEPVGTLSPAEIIDTDLLQMDENGGLLLGLAAGDPAQSELTVSHTREGSKISFWRIERLSLELFGTISP